MKHILIPVDFSDNARRALVYALNIAEATGSDVTVLNVFQLKARSHFMSLDKLKELEEQTAAECRDELIRFLDETFRQEGGKPAIEVKPLARIGFPIEEILALCEQQHFDLIVMGTKGVTNLREKILGTNTATVIDNVSIPVLSVPETVQYTRIKRIAFLGNFEAISLPSISKLIRLAKQLDAGLSLLHHNPDGYFIRTAQRKHYLQELEMAIPYDKVQAFIAEDSDVVTGIRDFLNETEVQLLAVSALEKKQSRALFSAFTNPNNKDFSQLPVLTIQA